MEVSARLADIDGAALSVPPQVLSNVATATMSKFSSPLRSAKVFQTTSIAAGASNCCSSARIVRWVSVSMVPAGPRYKASLRVCAWAQNDTHKTSNKALNVHDMVTLELNYISRLRLFLAIIGASTV